MRISDWSSDVCSSDLHALARHDRIGLEAHHPERIGCARLEREVVHLVVEQHAGARRHQARAVQQVDGLGGRDHVARSEEHTSELQSLMRISYAVFCLKNKKLQHTNANTVICIW